MDLYVLEEAPCQSCEGKQNLLKAAAQSIEIQAESSWLCDLQDNSSQYANSCVHHQDMDCSSYQPTDLHTHHGH